MHRRLLGCSDDAPPCQSGPAVRWHPSPWRQLIASPDGNCAMNATISPCFHLLTPAIAIAAFSFVLRAPLCPRPSSFHVPIAPFLFIKNPKSEGREKKLTDLVFYIELRLSLTPQSTAILPWPSHWPQSKSKEAYLNTPFMNMSCGGSKKKIRSLFLANKTFVLPVNVCSP